MTPHFILIQDIIISPDRQRRTFDPAKHNELVESIQYGKAGLQNPPVLRQNEGRWILVSGERRLRAITDIYELGGTFTHAGQPVPEGSVPFTPLGELSPIDAMEAELDENIRRADLSWQEHAEATSRLAQLRSAQTGIPVRELVTAVAEELEGSGIHGGSRRDTVRREIIVAQHLDKEEVRNAKTVDEAYKALKKTEKRDRHQALAAEVGKTFSAIHHKILNEDSLSWMTAHAPSTFDIILTDPPYGMGADDFGDSGGKTAGEHFYKDDAETALRCYEVLAKEGYRICKEDAHLYSFCDIEAFPTIKNLFVDAGWRVFRTPIIWYKPAAYRAPWPDMGPQRKYECILYAVKGNRKVNMLAPDVITCSPDENLGHNAQKPVDLYIDLLKRSVRPGDHVLDPFCGTGPIIPACQVLQCYATAIEQDITAFGIAVSRIKQLTSQQELVL